MRLYLSSFRMGDHPELLVALAGADYRRRVVIANAMDDAPPEVRRAGVELELAALAGDYANDHGRGSGQVSRVRRKVRVRAPSAPPVYSLATKSVTPASASVPILARTVSSSPTMATSAGPAAPSRSSMAR